MDTMIVLSLPNGIGDVLMAVPAIRRLAEARGIDALAIVVSSDVQRAMLREFIGDKAQTIFRYEVNRPQLSRRLQHGRGWRIWDNETMRCRQLSKYAWIV